MLFTTDNGQITTKASNENYERINLRKLMLYFLVLYVIVQLGLNALMVLVSVIIVRLHKTPTTKPPPSCLRKCANICAECKRTKDYEDPPYATFLQERPSIYQQQVYSVTLSHLTAHLVLKSCLNKFLLFRYLSTCNHEFGTVLQLREPMFSIFFSHRVFQADGTMTMTGCPTLWERFLIQRHLATRWRWVPGVLCLEPRRDSCLVIQGTI